MTTKCTWLFNGQSLVSGKSWGFSETWYTEITNESNIVAAMDLISSRRVLFLGQDTAIVGYRYGLPGARAFVRKRVFAPPATNSTSNIPNDAAQCQVFGSVTNSVKRFFLHDLSDVSIQSDVITPLVTGLIQDYLNLISTQNWEMRYVQQNAINAPILSIDVNGNVTTVGAYAATVGSYVTFLKSKDINGKPVRGQFVVTAVTDASHFAVAHWTSQIVARSGKVRLVNYSYQPVNVSQTISVLGAAQRKVGRPFFALRGRVSNRR